jgi:hypothetical protein
MFTPLNADFTEVFLAIKGDPAFKWPPKMKTNPYKRNRNKFCEYHENHGHSTEDCMSLCREIENFVQNGKLVRFLMQERIQEVNQQGCQPLEGNREGLIAMELRRQDLPLREGRYEDREEK